MAANRQRSTQSEQPHQTTARPVSVPAKDTGAPAVPADMPRGWRHGAVWMYLVMLAASGLALVVSFVLSAETLQMAREPGKLLSCDVNAVLSCSAVADSWQAEIVKFAGLRKYYRLNFDLMVDAVWIVALVTLILVKDGAYLFA